MDRAENARQQWQREIPGLPLDPMVVMGRLAEAAQLVMNRHIEPVFAAHGLKQGEFDVLATLRRSGAPYALTPTELYRSTMISSGGMTFRLDRLQKAGFIERRPHPTDRRAQLVCLTDAGKAVIDGMLTDYVTAQERALAALDPDQRAALSGLLLCLIEGENEGTAGGRRSQKTGQK